MEDLRAVGQVKPSLDLLIAMLVQKEPVDIEKGSQRSTQLAPSCASGRNRAGPCSSRHGQVGQVVLRPLKEQHDHIVATKLHKHVHMVLLPYPTIAEPSPGILQ